MNTAKGTLQERLHYGSWVGKIILDYLGRSNAIISVFIKGRQEDRMRRKRRDRGRGRNNTITNKGPESGKQAASRS